METLRVGQAREVERLHIWVAAVVDKSCLVTIKHCVQTQWEELVRVGFLDGLLFVIIGLQVIHVKQVREPVRVVVGSSHVAVFFGNNFADVLHEESASRDVLKREEAPHGYRVCLIWLSFNFLSFVGYMRL